MVKAFLGHLKDLGRQLRRYTIEPAQEAWLRRL